MEAVGGSQALQEFRAELLRDIYRGHFQLANNNYGHFNLSVDGVDRAKQVNVEARAACHHLVLIDLASSVAASLLLSDVTHRELFIRLITNHRLGQPLLRIWKDMTCTSFQKMLEHAAGFETNPPSKSLRGAFGSLKDFHAIPTGARSVSLDIRRDDLAWYRIFIISNDLGERTNLATKRSFRRNRYSSRSRSNSHHAVLRCHQQSPSDIRPNHDCV